MCTEPNWHEDWRVGKPLQRRKRGVSWLHHLGLQSLTWPKKSSYTPGVRFFSQAQCSLRHLFLSTRQRRNQGGVHSFKSHFASETIRICCISWYTFFVKTSRVMFLEKKGGRVANFSVPPWLLSCLHPQRSTSPLGSIPPLGFHICHGVRRQQTTKYGHKFIFTWTDP